MASKKQTPLHVFGAPDLECKMELEPTVSLHENALLLSAFEFAPH